MFINYSAVCYRAFAAAWPACFHGPSDCVWMVPGTFDVDGNTTLEGF